MTDSDKWINISNLCSNLQTLDKRTRKKKLEDIYNEIFAEKKSTSELQEIFKTIYIHILNCISDQSEACREISIRIVTDFVMNLNANDYYLTYILPAVEKRLGNIVIIEESEEVRLLLVKLIHTVIIKYKDKNLLPFFDVLVIILTKTVVDPYPKVKQESCQCISALTKAIPQDFHMQAETLLKPVVTLMTHQQFRVRISAVICTCDIIEYGGGKLPEDAIVGLACLTGDPQPSVRLAVAKTAHAWLLRFPDRYSYFPKILPLILLGLSDEVNDNKTEIQKLWNECGNQYAIENESELKNEMDFLTIPLDHYPFDISERPSFGCRVLVARNTTRLLTGIANELNDWREEIRILSARLLVTVCLHAENELTQQLQILLPAMYKSCRDRNIDLVQKIEYTGWIVGHFIPPNVYCDLILPVLEGIGDSAIGQLKTLAALMKGSKKPLLLEKLPEICESLENHDLCQCRKNGSELLNCCNQIISVCGEDCEIVSFKLFYIIVTVMSINKDAEVIDTGETLLHTLSSALKLQSVEQLYDLHIKQLLELIKPTATLWTIVKPEHCIFENLLLRAGSSVGKHFDIILSILKDALDDNADPEAKLKVFIALSIMLVSIDFDNPDDKLKSTMATMILEIVIPTVTWHAGRTAESVRGAAIMCCCALLPICNDKVDVGRLVPALIGLLEDRVIKTRQLALTALDCLFKCQSCQLDVETVNRVYPELLKRLDDGDDKVRIEAMKALASLWTAFNLNTYDSKKIHTAHIDHICAVMLIHLDDPDTIFQQHSLDVLKIMAKINKNIVCDKVNKAIINMNNQDICSQLLEDLKNFDI